MAKTKTAVWGTGSLGVAPHQINSFGGVECPHNDDGTLCPRCALESLTSAGSFRAVSLLNRDVELCVRQLMSDQRDMLIEKPETIMIAGGFIRSVLARERIRDVDIFVNTKAEAEAILNVWKSWSAKPVSARASMVAITLATTGIPTQLIYRFPFTNPSDVLKSFDFTVSQAALWFGHDRRWRGMCCQSYYQDLASKKLVYTSPERDDQDIRLIGRIIKHTQLGYSIDRYMLSRVLATIVRNLVQNQTAEKLKDIEAMEKDFLANDLKKFSVSPEFEELCRLSNADRQGSFDPKPVSSRDWDS